MSLINILTYHWKKLLLYFIAILFIVSIGITIHKNEFYYLLIPFIAIVSIIPIFNARLFFQLFLLSFPFTSTVFLANNALSTSLPAEPMMAILLGVFVLLVAYRPRLFPQWFLRNKLTLIIALQFVWLLVSVLFAQDYFLAIKFLAAKVWFLVSCFLFPVFIFKEKKDFKIAFMLVVVPTMLHAIVVFVMHAYYKFGYYESNMVVEPFYKNHVDYGTMISMMFPLLGCAYFESKGNRRIRFWLFLAILFSIAATYTSFSRGAILAVCFTIIVYFAIRLRLNHFILPTFYVFILSIVLFMAKDNRYLNYTPNKSENATQDTFFDTVIGAFTGEDMSSMERFYRWIATIRMSHERPIVGVGPNNWYSFYKPHTVSSFQTWVSENIEKSTTHNYFLLMLSEQGYPGMLLYAILMMVIFAQAQKTYYRFRDKTYKNYTMAITMMLAAAFINNFFSEFLEVHKIGGLFYIAICLLIILDKKSKEEQQSNTALPNDTITS